MQKDIPHILLVNPWIHDFAAYDFWAKPIGLLYLGAILRHHGFKTTYIDCLDRFHPEAPAADPYAQYGRGPYYKTRIQKPDTLKNIPRNFTRYGIKKDWLKKDLLAHEKPDLILMTSLMTYWYPGVQETIRRIKEIYPQVPVVLGGIYASLCHEHAVKHSGADFVEPGQGVDNILGIAGKLTRFQVTSKIDTVNPDNLPYPAFDLQRVTAYIPLLTSVGCPFSCAYCASIFLAPERKLRSPASVIEEIKYWHGKYKIKDFVFYDDALLVEAERHVIPMLRGIIETGLTLRFHTPNGVHIREITETTAELMYRAGFKALRLGLETAVFEDSTKIDAKLTEAEFTRAISHLKNAGFEKDQVGAYLLTGLPGQSICSIEDSINIVLKEGIAPILAHYTPVPHTKLWDTAVAASSYDLLSDPVLTNNAISPCGNDNYSKKELSRLKRLAAG